jgi:hypothetical protein
LLDETNDNIYHDKLITIKQHIRPTYSDIFSIINNISNEDDINVLSNSDIYFDDTVKLLNCIRLNECYALSRYENNTILINGYGSQDTWVFKGKIKNINANFFLGVPGCDNRIAYEIQQVGYNVMNPSLSIKTHHVHKSCRNWSSGDANTISPPYLYVNMEYIK